MISYLHTKELQERIRQKQNQKDSISEKESKRYFNDKVVSSINVASEFIFKKLPAMASSVTKKQDSAENSTEKSP
jgi:hypothetical protein